MRTSTLTLLWCLLLAALGGGVHARTEIVARAAIVYNDGKDGGGGEAGGESWAEATDPQTSTLALEEAQVNAAAGGGGATTTTRLEREYVWGPGDKGLDELLVQYDAATASGGGRTPWWCLQDAGGDVVMLARAGGANGTATCAAQWTYDAYGAVIAENVFNAGAPVSRAGHKGLFADRLDGAVVTTDGGPDTKRLAVGGKLLYYNRNRTFSPELGRFLQSDPNATALTLLEALRYQGRSASALAAALDLQQLYGDGANLYGYLAASPWERSDPLGLSWDPFDMVDEYLAEDAGSKAAFMEQVMGGFNSVAHIGLQVAQLHPAVGMVTAAVKLGTGSASWFDVFAALPAGNAAKNALGRAFASYWKGQHSMRGARRAGLLADNTYELHHVIPQFMTGWARGRAVVLTRVQHQRYHQILDDVLRGRGMPTRNGGERAWRDWFARHYDEQHAVRDVLIESVEMFSSRGGGRHAGRSRLRNVSTGFCPDPVTGARNAQAVVC